MQHRFLLRPLGTEDSPWGARPPLCRCEASHVSGASPDPRVLVVGAGEGLPGSRAPRSQARLRPGRTGLSEDGGAGPGDIPGAAWGPLAARAHGGPPIRAQTPRPHTTHRLPRHRPSHDASHSSAHSHQKGPQAEAGEPTGCPLSLHHHPPTLRGDRRTSSEEGRARE